MTCREPVSAIAAVSQQDTSHPAAQQDAENEDAEHHDSCWDEQQFAWELFEKRVAEQVEEEAKRYRRNAFGAALGVIGIAMLMAYAVLSPWISSERPPAAPASEAAAEAGAHAESALALGVAIIRQRATLLDWEF